MRSAAEWPVARRIDTRRLILDPLRVSDSHEMVFVLGETALYEYTGGAPPSLEELRSRYARQTIGHSPDHSRGWLNWIVRERVRRTAVGLVQATVSHERHGMVAEIAWLIGVPDQGRGYATEAAEAMIAWLGHNDVSHVSAQINPRHAASIAVAQRLGLTATGTVIDGETRWTLQRSSRPQRGRP
jgi:RimJ/RimL family protein N-acetyltransferase